MKAAIASIGIVVGALVVFEVTMSPSGDERVQLLIVFGLMALLAGLVGILLPRWSMRLRSLRSRVFILVAAALSVVVLAAVVTAQLMFVTVHDLNLLLIVLGYGIALGIVLATTLARPLAADLQRIQQAADGVAAGDLSARTGVERRDELGTAAAAFDSMAARLQAAEESRRQFLAAVGHDLRTPLAALQATVEALEDGLAPDPERYVRSMRADVDALGHLVDDLFLLATIEAGKLAVERVPIDLTELADESIEALQPMASRQDVGLRLVAAGGVTTVGGSAELSRVIRNLLDNAIRHAPAGSEVTVEVTNGRTAELRVSDAGPGFPPGFVESAFEGFVTGDPARSRASGGAGLGLAIAHGVIAAHGGQIWAEPGPGGRVAFRLPAAG